MATHSSVLAWRIPGMAEPGGLPSMGSHRVGHDCSDLAAAAAGIIPPGNFPENLGYVKSSSIEPHDTLGSLYNTFHVILK